MVGEVPGGGGSVGVRLPGTRVGIIGSGDGARGGVGGNHRGGGLVSG